MMSLDLQLIGRVGFLNSSCCLLSLTHIKIMDREYMQTAKVALILCSCFFSYGVSNVLPGIYSFKIDIGSNFQPFSCIKLCRLIGQTGLSIIIYCGPIQ